ncbi:alpha/beta hydrolase [Chryseobacterium arthrosphaerae]|uniref:alpha/beta fold hydrolase n=1 Tax=Chryseobacterium arthrosphaerae TaxID=651561 RepID=UPI0023E2FEF6|nr:alpha/beta hydrolase [Chryseobacterium arthrosphaerae]WES98730.1 alpha/beta hydrolase [Chryseobacterium arthrosphaerae]
MNAIRKFTVASALCATLFFAVTISCSEDNDFPTAQETSSVNHNNAKTNFINVKGTDYAYRTWGKEGGIPLVLLPGTGGSMDDWDPAVTDGLAKEYKLIIFDNKGVASSKGSTPNTIQAMANDAIDFIKAMKFEKVNIMGFSMGGFIAQRIVLTEPGLVNKIILADSGPKGAIGLSNLPNIIAGAAGLSPEQSYLKFGFTDSQKSITAGKESFARVNKRAADRDLPLSDATSTAQFTAVLAWAQPDTGALEEIKAIKKPVLIVHGDKDLPISIQNAYNMKESLENAVLLEFSDSGHAAFYQNHEVFLTKALEFLAK